MKRILTAAVLIPFVLYAVLWGPPWLFYLVLAAVSELCYHEYAGIAAAAGAGRLPIFGYAAGLALLALPWAWAGLAFTLAVIVAMTWSLRESDPLRGFTQSAMLALGLVYIFGSWKTGVLLHDISPYWLVFALVINWIGDTGAFYIGRKYGKHKLAPRVSPGKSWEGAIASVVVAVVFGVLFLPYFVPPISLAAAALLSMVVNAAGQVGDLAESALKRGAGVKDSGTLLPGHGGMLDRVDSSLFALPVTYAIVMCFQPTH